MVCIQVSRQTGLAEERLLTTCVVSGCALRVIGCGSSGSMFQLHVSLRRQKPAFSQPEFYHTNFRLKQQYEDEQMLVAQTGAQLQHQAREDRVRAALFGAAPGVPGSGPGTLRRQGRRYFTESLHYPVRTEGDRGI